MKRSHVMGPLFTIGHSNHPLETFLRQAGVKRLIDVRLNNVSQLAGFAKRQADPCRRLD